MLTRREAERALKAFVEDARAKGMNVAVDRFKMRPDGVRVRFLAYRAVARPDGGHDPEGTMDAHLPWETLRKHLHAAPH